MENLSDIEKKQRSAIRILVVDDREDNLLSIESILEEDGYTIIKADSGRSALKILLQQQEFTLILMDVQMPGMNGFETASIIFERDKLKHIPIIFITADNASDESTFRGYKMGAVDYIYKPINPDLLRLKVAVFAELSQKNLELLDKEKNLRYANQKLEKEIIRRKLDEEKIRLLNEQLIEKNYNLEATIEELDRFAYVASHDLQEPLRKIRVFSDRILMFHSTTVNDDVKKALEKIVKASGRMQSLINDLLKFSRDTFVGEDFGIVDLNNIIAEVISDMDVNLEQADAKIVVNELPKIWGMQSQMRQLFQNIISNSMKFKKTSERPVINIYTDATATLPRIVIEDNGIGFDSKYADEIFAVFKRLHSFEEYEGTGVGLAICKKIIQNHKGNIYAEGSLNKGAKFYIELPPLNGEEKMDAHLQQAISLT